MLPGPGWEMAVTPPDAIDAPERWGDLLAEHEVVLRLDQLARPREVRAG